MSRLEAGSPAELLDRALTAVFTGIIQGLFPVKAVKHESGITHYAVEFSQEMLEGLQIGASVAINGVCQTAVRVEGRSVWFDAIQETLNRTTLKSLKEKELVNVERSAKFGDEIGGHILSGHIYGTAEILRIEKSENNVVVVFRCPAEWMKYFFSKGYIALDGASLTLVDVDPAGVFTVHLIPETLRATTFGYKKAGALVNVEFDSRTQAVVDTVERIMNIR